MARSRARMVRSRARPVDSVSSLPLLLAPLIVGACAASRESTGTTTSLASTDKPQTPAVGSASEVLVATGYAGRIVLLTRPPVYGLDVSRAAVLGAGAGSVAQTR